MEEVKNDVRKLLEKYSLARIAFAIRDLIDEESQFIKLTIEDQEDLKDANRVTGMAKVIAGKLGDHCGETHLNLNLAKWIPERKESVRVIKAKLDALAEERREEYDRSEYKRLKEKYEHQR